MGDSGIPSFGSSDNSPKIGVSWFEANEFLCRLNRITGRSFRLPTDAEWEFAARGGNAGKENNYRYSGSNNADDVAWHSGNSGNRPHEVGTKAPNQLGIYDMSGNAWEWVYDWLVAYTDTPRPIRCNLPAQETRHGAVAAMMSPQSSPVSPDAQSDHVMALQEWGFASPTPIFCLRE
jgi:formylglycine-generating enzyme required for sulfatase activity